MRTTAAVRFVLGVQEQSSMAKVGLELRLLSSDVDAELEKWEEQEQQVARHSQSVASMAYNMYLFTRFACGRRTVVVIHGFVFNQVVASFLCFAFPEGRGFSRPHSIFSIKLR